MKRLTAILALFLTVSCERTTSVAPDGTAIQPVFDGGGGSSCSNTGNEAVGWWVKINNENPFACGATVPIYNNAGLPGAVVSSAIAIWNSGVLGAYGLPVFATSGSGTGVTVVTSGSGDYACGNADIVNRTVTIYRASSEATCGGGGFRAVLYSSQTEMAKLLGHELGHALGITSKSWSFGAGWASDAYTKYCVMSVPPTGPLNGSVCEYERQLVYYAYGLHNNLPDVGKNWILELERTPAVLSLALGDSGLVTVEEMIIQGQDADSTIAPDAHETFAYALTGAGASHFSLIPSGSQVTVTNDGSYAGATVTIGVTSTRFNVKWPLAVFTTVSTPAPLTVNAGSGGYVTSSPAGIDTRTVSTFSFPYNTSVTLTPHADAGYQFSAWTGDCSGASCVVTMNTARTVGASFVAIPLSAWWQMNPTPVKPNKSCQWSVSAEGGTPPYSYEWRKNGQLVGKPWGGAVLTMNTGYSSFELTWKVTDANQTVVTDSMYVTVSSSSPSDCTY